MSELVTELLPLARIGTEYVLFIVGGAISLVAFVALILVPAVGSYGRGWEKAAAGFLSLFALLALVLLGAALGVAIVYYWDDISRAI
jgi:hypothetical protein